VIWGKPLFNKFLDKSDNAYVVTFVALTSLAVTLSGCIAPAHQEAAPKVERRQFYGSPGLNERLHNPSLPEWSLDAYNSHVQDRLKKIWAPPASSKPLVVIFAFYISRNGDASNITMTRSSGDTAFDIAAKRAIVTASPFKLVGDNGPGNLNMEVEFESDQAKISVSCVPI
jgi:TonB family protein